MPIASSDLEYRRTVNTGPGNSTAQADAQDSHGAFVSTTECGLVKNDIFDDVTGDENAASDVEYRAIAIVNLHATLTLQNAKAWLQSEVAEGANFALGLAPEGVVNTDSASAQCERTTDEGAAPTGVTFSAPTTKTAGLEVGNIGPGQTRILWVRRTATASAALNDDGCVIRVAGDTAA